MRDPQMEAAIDALQKALGHRPATDDHCILVCFRAWVMLTAAAAARLACYPDADAEDVPGWAALDAAAKGLAENIGHMPATTLPALAIKAFLAVSYRHFGGDARIDVRKVPEEYLCDRLACNMLRDLALMPELSGLIEGVV